MQERKIQKPMLISQYANSLIIDMKSLSNILKPLSKNLYQNNNQILNEVLSSKQQQLLRMITKVLAHTLQISNYKALISQVLSITNKSITCIKTQIPQIEGINHANEISTNASTNNSNSNGSKINREEQVVAILHKTIDILVSVTSQHKQAQETGLRILQTTFSLIDHLVIKYYDFDMICRLFMVCFDFCEGTIILHNIAISALSALSQGLMQFGRIKQGYALLSAFLNYLLASKKFIWIKPKDVKGLIWDLVVICIKNFNANHIIALDNQKETLQLIQKMYEIVQENIFLKKSKTFYTPPHLTQKQKSAGNSGKIQSNIADFIRFFKAYVALSASLSIEAYRVVQKEFVPFRQTIPKLLLVCDIQRNSRMFIFLQAICQLLLDQYVLFHLYQEIPLVVQKGMIFMEILSKIGQQLCWCNQNGVKVNWEFNENYLDKVVSQEPKIGDGDFARLLKNTIVQLRMKYEKDEDLINCKKLKKLQKQSSRSSKPNSLPQTLGSSKKWQIFMKNVIRIIRYLSSLNFINSQQEQDPTRKIILQLQYWFLLCPVAKAKNMVLQQLLITANVLNNRMQAIKVSQSVQIGSNILYGYYQDLDSMGLTIILKMMAGIKSDWEDGKSFQELDQIYNLCSNIFEEQKLVKNEASFVMTIQALVQCISSLIADIEQPKQPKQKGQSSIKNPQNTIKRSYKMIDFLTQRLIVVLKNNLSQAAVEWNFITGFLITLCINKNQKIKQDGVKAIGTMVNHLLKNQLSQDLDKKKQTDVMGLYEQLAKSKIQVKEIEMMLIDQLKMIMPRIKQQSALIDGFRIFKILSQIPRNSAEITGSLNQLQEILIKECLFKITEVKYLRLILDGMQIKVSQKNQEYRLINLLWSIADYFRKITPKQNISVQYLDLWQALFKSIWGICEATKQCETKQSAIHSITQILAEAISILPFNFIIRIISNYYHQMVLLLLGIHASSIIDSEKSPETAKIALKNYIKMFKKLISIQNKSEQQKKQVVENISQINQSITNFVKSHVQNKNTGNITLQFLYELLNFIFLVNSDKSFEQYGVGQDLKQMFTAIQDLIKVCQQKSESGEVNTKMDLKSHMFKKKLKPLLDKVKQTQNLSNKQEEAVENKSQTMAK